jgi:LPXTG-site transpeptidase (sortase) family protein
MEKRLGSSIVLLAFFTLICSTLTASAILKKPLEVPNTSELPATIAVPVSAVSEPQEMTVAPLPKPQEADLSTVKPAVPIPQPVSSDIPASHPAFLEIPSIGLSKPVKPVGLTADGAMDVLNDKGAVGWYKLGAKPGETGSAVMDAHVYQAFKNLKNVKIGDEIFVEKGDGAKLRFKVVETKVYDYTATEPLQKIFNRKDKPRLNLITCYGVLTADRSTYTHRLVVYAELQD